MSNILKKIVVVAIVIVGVLLLVTVVPWGLKEFNRTKELNEARDALKGSVQFFCEGTSPTGFGVTIKKEDDGQYHLIVASKPPQSNIIVTKTATASGDRYEASDIVITDELNNLHVSYRGEELTSCNKHLP